MKVIVLTGLVSIEKVQLARDLAQHFVHDNEVHIIDNIARQAIKKMDKVAITRYEEDIIGNIPDILRNASVDLAIVAISEQSHPEKLFIALDDLQEQESDWEIYTLALIDIRTCDCFPNVREALENYADASIMMPYNLDDIVSYVDNT